MAYATEIIERLEQLKSGFTTMLEESIQETESGFIDLNTQQMYEGKNSDGGEIGAYRSEVYAEMKNQMNSLPGFGVPDLKLTGAFYEGYSLRIQGGEIEETSNVP